MKKESILAGLGGGVLFGAIQSFSMGAASGVLAGCFFGVAISIFLHVFANSESVNSQINVPEAVLLPGERILLTKLANLVVEPKNFGLGNLACDDLLWTVGMKNRESLGGALHLTNYRLIFKSHRFNRLRGMTSIFLPTIQQLENRTVLIFRKLTVSTMTAKVEFVVSDVDRVIAQIASTRDQMDTSTVAALKSHVARFPEKCSDGLETWDAINKLNSLVKFGKQTTDAAKAITNPLEALGSIFMGELLDKTLAERWQKVFRAAEQHAEGQSPKRLTA